MARMEKVSEFNSSANALDWAAKVLQMRFEEVLSLRENALNSADIEGVHEMRVSIRRLRSAMRDFSPLMKSRLLKESKKELKQLASTLGEARDQDVAIAGLEKLLKKTKNTKIKGEIKTKIEKRRSSRQNTQTKLAEILDENSLEKLKKDFSEAIDDAVQRNKKDSKLTAQEAGCEVISRSMEEFRDLSKSLYNPFNQLELHQLRIASKRLRYAVELFTVCWNDELQIFAEEVSQMQTFLGEVHDCDIWIENLRQRLNREKGEKLRADFWLLSKFTKKRTKNYRAALHLWSNWEKNKFMKRLHKVITIN